MRFRCFRYLRCFRNIRNFRNFRSLGNLGCFCNLRRFRHFGRFNRSRHCGCAQGWCWSRSCGDWSDGSRCRGCGSGYRGCSNGYWSRMCQGGAAQHEKCSYEFCRIFLI